MHRIEVLDRRGRDLGLESFPFSFSILKGDIIQVAPLSRQRRIFIRIIRNGKIIFRGTRKRASEGKSAP